jgi:hypothetical protein
MSKHLRWLQLHRSVRRVGRGYDWNARQPLHPGRASAASPHSCERDSAGSAALYRSLLFDVLEAQRRELIDVWRKRRIDKTVFRRIQHLLDLETVRIELRESTGQMDIEG